MRGAEGDAAISQLNKPSSVEEGQIAVIPTLAVIPSQAGILWHPNLEKALDSYCQNRLYFFPV